MNEPTNPRGRRPGNPQTRTKILTVAAAHFTSRGYTDTSMRAIAREANVDPALLRHYFADKTTLFLQAMEISLDHRMPMRHILTGSRHDLGERIIKVAMSTWESGASESIAAALQQDPRTLKNFGKVISSLACQAVEQLLADVPDPERRIRIAMVETIMAGIFFARYYSHIEPATSLPRDVFIRRWAPMVQRAIDGTM